MSNMKRYTFTKMKTFRVLFEKVSDRGKIGWTVIEDCIDYEDAIEFFRKQFSFDEYEIIQTKEVCD